MRRLPCLSVSSLWANRAYRAAPVSLPVSADGTASWPRQVAGELGAAPREALFSEQHLELPYFPLPPKDKPVNQCPSLDQQTCDCPTLLRPDHN